MKKLVVFVFVMLLSGSAVAGCLEYLGIVVQDTRCLGLPTIPKFSDPHTFMWKGKEILIINDGNELLLYDIRNPRAPVLKTKSNFNIGNQGDSDHDLMNYTYGDDVRFHVATFKRGNVVFDLGTGLWPAFGARQFYVSGSQPKGGFAFTIDNAHYIIAQNLPGSLGYSGTIYRVTTPSQLTAIGSVNAGTYVKITHGQKLWNGDYYLFFSDNSTHYYKWHPTAGLAWVVKTPIVGFMGWTKAISIKGKKLTTAWPQNNLSKYWDISEPWAPVQLHTFYDKYTTSAANWTDLFYARSLETTWDTSGAGPPVPLDQYFWDPSNLWNQPAVLGECPAPSGAVFSNNGEVMYYARYTVVQMVNFKACNPTGPTPTPTPPPWPTPMPTCVPGCVSNN